MKRRIYSIILVTLTAFSLTGCAETVPTPGSVSPSKPVVDTSSEEAPLNDLPPMLRVDGKLFKDTGKESDIQARCGVMDGEVTSTVDASEIPTQGYQSNFGSGFGYQFVGENSLDIYMNEKWMRFEAESSSENPIELALSVRDCTATGATLVFAPTHALSSHNFQTGSWYKLEKETEGSWYEINYVVDESTDIAWTEEAWILNQDAETTFEVDWEWLYGKLDAGTYRISKEIIDFRQTGDYDTSILSAEFILE